MMTLFSTLMPLISAAASFALARCRFGASFMRAPVELVEIAIRHPYHFLSYIFLSGLRRSGFQTGNWYAALFSDRFNSHAGAFRDLDSTFRRLGPGTLVVRSPIGKRSKTSRSTF